MPHWFIRCLWCGGIIRDGLLECLPGGQSHPAYRLLFFRQPGAALVCPYCNGLVGVDDTENAYAPQPGWVVGRYSRKALEQKREYDGVTPAVPFSEWYVRCVLWEDDELPPNRRPMESYTYAEDVPPNELVP